MPMGQYSSFAECMRKNKNKGDPNAYCGKIYQATEGNNKLKHKPMMNKNKMDKMITKEMASNWYAKKKGK